MHGVSNDNVVNAPTFGQLWPYLSPYFEDSVIIAHHVPFVMAVLSKVLNDYGIDHDPVWTFDTCACAPEYYPEALGKSLSALCDYLHIDLSPGALGHASAAAEVFLDMQKRGISRQDFYLWDFPEHLYDNTYISG